MHGLPAADAKGTRPRCKRAARADRIAAVCWYRSAGQGKEISVSALSEDIFAIELRALAICLGHRWPYRSKDPYCRCKVDSRTRLWYAAGTSTVETQRTIML